MNNYYGPRRTATYAPNRCTFEEIVAPLRDDFEFMNRVLGAIEAAISLELADPSVWRGARR